MLASEILVLILRWMLFRTELGSGLIKLRHDPCWTNLTCLFYHYETQPLPNPLSWFFHYLPAWAHRFGAVFSHFVQIIVLEHAGPDIWGDIDDTVSVEAWERKGDGLIPAHWIPSA